MSTTECEFMPLWPDGGQRLGTGRTVTYQAARRGDFPVVRIGKRFFIPRRRFEHWLKTGEDRLPENAEK